MAAPQRPLGALLVEMGFVSPDQLEAALAEQQRSHKRLGKLLIESGTITEDRLVHALSQQLGIEACDPIMTPVHEAVLAMLPSQVAFEHRILPVARQRDGEAEILYVATADPLDQVAFEAVTSAIPPTTSLRWMLAGETEMDLALARHYGAAPTENRAPPEGRVRVIAGKPIAPPRRPEGSAAPLHSTGDIFAALQEAVELSGDLPGSDQPTSQDPEPPPQQVQVSADLDVVKAPPSSSGDLPNVGTSRDLQVVFPNAPEGASLLGGGPEPSQPSMDLARLSGELHDDISEEILEAEEVIESGVQEVPESIPSMADLQTAAEAAAQAPPEAQVREPAPAPAPAEDPVVPPVEAAPVVPAGPSWADMVGGQDEDEDEDEDDLGQDLRSAQAEAATMPAATGSLAAVPAPTGPPPPSEALPTPSAISDTPPPTQLDLSDPGAIEAFTSASEVTTASGSDLAPAPAPLADAGLPAFSSSAPEPLLAADPGPEFGLDGLPLDAPPPEASPRPFATPPPPELEPELLPHVPAPAQPVPAPLEPPPLDAPPSLEAPPPGLGLDSLGTPSAPTPLSRAREVLGRFVRGESADPLEMQWVLRVVAALALQSEIVDEAQLASAVERVGPPPG